MYTFIIENGFDYFNNRPLYRVKGTNNEYLGEWVKTKREAKEEIRGIR